MSRRSWTLCVALVLGGALLPACAVNACHSRDAGGGTVPKAPPTSGAPSVAASAVPPPAPVRPRFAAHKLAYDGLVVEPPDASDSLRSLVRDFAFQLGFMTGHEIHVAAGPAERGIVLVGVKDAKTNEELARLADLGPEGYYVHSDDDARLRIVANAEVGLFNGVHAYMHELGFRWFFPQDEWNVVPPPRDLGLRIDVARKPAFRVRSFFGTGKFGPATPVMPNAGAEQERWDRWSLRNGFGEQFHLGGHAGQEFAQAHRAELEAHPEYLAQVDGKRIPWSPSARYCVSNRGLQKLFVEDRVAAMKALIQRAPDSPFSFAVSVEPADGVGHCECSRCRLIGKGDESDQTFYLANLVAKALRKEVPGHYASLMAYGQHASPPSIPIDPGVYVRVAPEAFQKTGVMPDELIAVWKKRVPRLSLYTYWSIPDWGFDLPSFDYIDVPVERLRTWRKLGIEGVTFETSYGTGAMGIGLYVASRLMWDLDADVSKILDDFYRSAFHAAAPPMRRLLERWARSFTPTSYELGFSYRDLAEAHALVKDDPEALRRVRDYEIYLQYVRLFVEHTAARKDVARARAVITWAYRSNGMVGSYRMRELILNRWTPDAGLKEEFSYQDGTKPGWAAAVAPISEGELAGLMRDGARTYPVPEVEAKGYSPRLVKPLLRVPASPSVSALAHANPPETQTTELFVSQPTDFEIEAEPGQHLTFDVTIAKHKTIPFESVTVRGADGKVVYEERLKADGSTRRVSLDVPPGRYFGRVDDQKATFKLEAPAGTRMVLRTLTSASLSPRVYFWVPAGLRKFALFAPSSYPIEILDPEGRHVDSAPSGTVVVPVPEGQDGRAWSIRHYKSWETIRMINLPQVFALSPEALLVPEDAQGQAVPPPVSSGSVQ